MRAEIDFCGETSIAEEGSPIVLGREAEITVDDNPYLHRRFLEVAIVDGLCWLRNLGSQLSATVVDDASRTQAWLSPGSSLPLVFRLSHVRFTAGPTTYEFTVALDEAPFETSTVEPEDASSGTKTIGQMPLTPDQKKLIVALAEPLLLQEGRGSAAIPSSAEAARRLGWTTTKFTRKLDNVCGKLAKIGVRGLHGEPGRLAANRRARLVEYAVAVGLVVETDLQMLDQ